HVRVGPRCGCHKRATLSFRSGVGARLRLEATLARWTFPLDQRSDDRPARWCAKWCAGGLRAIEHRVEMRECTRRPCNANVRVEIGLSETVCLRRITGPFAQRSFDGLE